MCIRDSWSTWDRQPFGGDESGHDDYAVSVHRLPQLSDSSNSPSASISALLAE